MPAGKRYLEILTTIVCHGGGTERADTGSAESCGTATCEPLATCMYFTYMYLGYLLGLLGGERSREISARMDKHRKKNCKLNTYCFFPRFASCNRSFEQGPRTARSASLLGTTTHHLVIWKFVLFCSPPPCIQCTLATCRHLRPKNIQQWVVEKFGQS